MNIPLYIFLGVLVFLLILFTVFLFLKIRLEISYKKENGKKGRFCVVTTLLGGRIRKEISPKENLNGKNNKKAKDKKDESDSISVSEKIEEKQKIFSQMREVWAKSRRKIRKNIFVEEIFLDMSVGFEDAFYTGVVSGSLWALCYTVIGFLSDIIKIRVPDINIKPVYNEDFFETDAKCIVAASPVNIIAICFKVLVSYYIVKKKLDKETKKEKAAKNYGNTN